MIDAGQLEALVSQQIVTAMKARDADRTTTLRLIKNALKNKAIEKREALTQAESEQTLASMIKQRRDSIEQTDIVSPILCEEVSRRIRRDLKAPLFERNRPR